MRIAPCLSAILLAFSASALAAPKSANVVSITGKGELRQADKQDWGVVKTQQDLFGGDFVRTGDLSQMAILFIDNTQIRLNQNSQLQIKSLADAAGGATTVKLNSGRAWSQIKPQTGGDGLAKAKVSMETPSATMSIRGTDWEVEVGPDGKTQLVVLSGEVDMGNAHGAIRVGRNEAAVAEVGKAPVKIVLASPESRVQWVTAYRSEAPRYLAAAGGEAPRHPALVAAAEALRAGQLAEAGTHLKQVPEGWPKALMEADILAMSGSLDEAIARSRAAVAMGPAAMPRAHLAGLLLMTGQNRDAAEARALLAETLKGQPEATEAWLAEGRRARFEGEAPRSQAAYGRAGELAPTEARAWQGLGVVASEREDVPRARGLLTRAAELDRTDATTFGELGTLESFANRFEAAEAAFAQALALRPDDYVALTGRGILRLKEGRTEEALEDFLRAGLMEPRYARARLYTGVAYYQLERPSRALEEFAKAAELDQKDPLPHLMASMVQTDLFDADAAVTSARAAMVRMPNLKSLNQVATNQKGAANVGNALSFRGMREWALAYAEDAYYPFWGGSSLFLADLYTSKYAKNSALNQGFIADPLVFGASNRYQTLIHRPGHYQTFSLTAGQDHSVRELIPRVTLNGYTNSLTPLAYFIEADEQQGNSRGDQDFHYRDRTGSLTAALGWTPTHDLRLFAYYNRDDTRARFSNSTISKLRFDSPTSELSVGGSYYFAPTTTLQARFGRNRVEGEQNWSYPSTLRGHFDDEETSRDGQLAFRHRWNDHFEFTSGVEKAKSPEDSLLTLGFTGLPATYSDGASLREKTSLGYASFKWLPGGADQVQMDLWWTDYEKRNVGDVVELGVPRHIDARYSVDRVSPRFGFSYAPTQPLRVRYAYQDWVRPSSPATLGPVTTAGVAMDERFLRFGGKQKRHVAKLESEVSPRLFGELAYENQRVRNLDTYDISLAENFANLSRLRQKSLSEVADFYAGSVATGELTNANLASHVKSDEVRANVNALLTREWSGQFGYQWADTRLTVDGSDRYYLPRHTLRAGATWISPLRWKVSFSAEHRSKSWSLDDISRERDAYWTGALSAYWESTDKRTGVVVFARELHNPNESAFYGIAANLRF